jgi:hypothetical protein
MRYTIKESQYKRLINLISEQGEEATSPTTPTKFAAYGDITTSSTPEAQAVVGNIAAGQNIDLFTDKELKTKYATYQFESMTNNGGNLDVKLKGTVNFDLTANCNTLPTDGAFSKGNVKYYSKVLSDMATEKCKTQ